MIELRVEASESNVDLEILLLLIQFGMLPKILN